MRHDHLLQMALYRVVSNDVEAIDTNIQLIDALTWTPEPCAGPRAFEFFEAAFRVFKVWFD